MNHFRLVLIFCFLTNFVCVGFTQQGIGIGTSKPDASAVLHVASEGKNQGILIPRLTQSEMLNIATSEEGLMVYNMTDGAIYHFFMGRWSIMGTPRGAILLWSGNESTLPYGWALCDGRWYNPKNHTDRGTAQTATRTIRTPDLRGRFIAGLDPEYSGQNNDYDNAGDLSLRGSSFGDSGGIASNTLSLDHIPAHHHNVNLTTDTDGAHSHDINYTGAVGKQVGRNTGGGEAGADDTALTATTNERGNHAHSLNGLTGDAGASSPQPLENRPPYYVLAFIMKL